jgi:hypothetical protein
LTLRFASWDPGATLRILGVFAAGILITRLLIVDLPIPLPRDPLRFKIATTAILWLSLVVLPYAFAWRSFGLSPAALGVHLRNLGASLGLGCALYALALVFFVFCSGDPIIARHPARFLEKPENVALLASSMSLHAAGTDVATRGFILLSLERFSPVWFAILMQNVVWFWGHVYEVELLSNCLGWWAGGGLFLALGVLGDMVALRTRNVVGIALGHILLNLVMIAYIRQL